MSCSANQITLCGHRVCWHRYNIWCMHDPGHGHPDTLNIYIKVKECFLFVHKICEMSQSRHDLNVWIVSWCDTTWGWYLAASINTSFHLSLHNLGPMRNCCPTQVVIWIHTDWDFHSLVQDKMSFEFTQIGIFICLCNTRCHLNSHRLGFSFACATQVVTWIHTDWDFHLLVQHKMSVDLIRVEIMNWLCGVKLLLWIFYTKVSIDVSSRRNDRRSKESLNIY